MKKKGYMVVVGEDFDQLQKLTSGREIVEWLLNFSQSPSIGVCYLVPPPDGEKMQEEIKKSGLRAKAFATEDGAKRGVRRVLGFPV